MNAAERRDHIRAMLADLRLPGALESVDEILADVDRGSLHASQAIERLLTAQITLRSNDRPHTAMRCLSPRSAASRSRAARARLHQAQGERDLLRSPGSG